MAQAINNVAQSDTFRPISERAVHVLALMAAKKAVREQMRDEGRRVSLVPPAELNVRARAYLEAHRAELVAQAIATAWKIAADEQRARLNKWLFDDERRARKWAHRAVLVTPDRT